MSSITQFPYQAQVMFRSGQIKVKYSNALSKGLLPTQKQILTEKITEAYQTFHQTLSGEELKGIKKVDFLFKKNGQVTALVVKRHKNQQSYSIDAIANKNTALKKLENEIVGIVDQIRHQTFRPKKILDVYAINRGDHIDVIYSKKVSPEYEKIIREKVIQVFNAMSSKENQMDEIDFSFSESHHLEVMVISGSQKNLYEGNALLAARADSVDKKELFEAIDHMGKSSLEPIAASQNIFQKFIRFVQRIVSFRRTVHPLIQKSIRQMIAKENDVENLKELYKYPHALSRMIQNAVLASSASHPFSENEIRDLIQDELRQGIQTRLKELKQLLWDKETINQLDAQRIVHQLATHSNESNLQLFKELQSIPVLDIPITNLKNIPVTPQNRDYLAHTWKHFIETAFKEGNLNKLVAEADVSEGIIQARYASAYSSLNHYMPEKLKNIVVDMNGDTLQKYCNRIEAKQSIEKLYDFVIQRSNESIDSDILGEAGIFYEECVAPALADMNLNQLSLFVIGNSLASKDLALMNQFIDKVRENEEESEFELTSFDNHWLQSVLRNELEYTAAKKHRLITPQLAMLRKLRVDSEKQQVQLKTIRSEIKKYSAEETFIKEAKQFLAIKKELSNISIHSQDKEIQLDALWDQAAKKGENLTQANRNKSDALFLEIEELKTQKKNLQRQLREVTTSSSKSPWLKKLINRKDINIVNFEREIKNRQGHVKEQFDAWSNQFFKDPLSIEALKNLTIQAKKSELKKIEALWKQVLTQEFEKVDLNHLSPHTRIENLREQFKGFVLAKAHFRSFMLNPINGSSSKHQDLTRKISSVINALEKQIEHPSIRKYLDRAATPNTLDINEALYGNEVLQAVVSENAHYSAFTATQQANLMHLNKVLHKALRKQPVTIEDQMGVTKTLELLRKDKAFSTLIKQLDDENSMSDTFLNYLPKSLHGFIKHRILKDVKNKERPKILGGIDQNTISFLKNYLARAKNLNELQAVERLNTKAQALLIKVQDPALAETIRKEDRLNLRELGILSRSERLKDGQFVKHLEALGVLELDPDLKKWVENHKKTEEIFKTLKTVVFQPDVDEHYKDGCILAHSTTRKVAWSGRSASLEERAIAWVANGFTHGAKLFHDKDGHVNLSHVQGEYEQDPLNLFELSTSEIWEIDVAPLVDSSLHVELETIYGKDWKNHINKMYQKIEKKIHGSGKEKFKQIENSEERRIKAGLANRPWLYRLLGQTGLKGHKASVKNNLNKIHEHFFKGEALKEEQICSEFVSKVTLVSMLELNRKIAKDIRKHQGISKEIFLDQISKAGIPLEEDVEKYINGKRYYKEKASRTEKAEQGFRNVLKALGKSKKDIELTIRLGNQAILDLPYKDERMHAIHPGRMVTILTDKKCAKLLPPPPKLAKIINFDPAAAKPVKK